MNRFLTFLLILAITKEYIYLNEEVLVILSFLVVVTVAFVAGGDSTKKALDSEVLSIFLALRDSFSAAKGSLLTQKKEILAVLATVAAIPFFALAAAASASVAQQRINEDLSVHNDAILVQLAGSVLDTTLQDNALCVAQDQQQSTDVEFSSTFLDEEGSLAHCGLPLAAVLPEEFPLDEDLEVILALNCAVLVSIG